MQLLETICAARWVYEMNFQVQFNAFNRKMRYLLKFCN